MCVQRLLLIAEEGRRLSERNRGKLELPLQQITGSRWYSSEKLQHKITELPTKINNITLKIELYSEKKLVWLSKMLIWASS